MLNNFLAAGAVFAVISSEALAQCPDCEDLTCNWFACGCMRSVGAGCTTTIATEVVLQGILGQPQPVAGPLTVSCCSSTIPCGPNTLTYTQSTGYTFCVTVSGGWGGGLLPGCGLPLESRTPPVGRIAPARRSVFHVHNASLYP